TPTSTASARETVTHTPTVVAAVIEPTPELVPETALPADGEGIPPEAVVGGLVLLAVIGYIGLYLRGAAAADRYAGGFVIEQCPVCRQGRLTVETRQNRLAGIPRPRRIVRCNHCRSV